MFIYKIVNDINGKVYIGKTKDVSARWKRHLQLAKAHKNKKLYDAMNCHGIQNFHIEIIESCSENEVDERERYYISKYNSTDKDFGYNTASGGEGGDTFSNNPNKEELRKKFSRAHKGFKHSEASKAIMREYALGRPPMSDGVKEKISNKLQEYYSKHPEKKLEITSGLREFGSCNPHPMLHKHHSDTAKRAMSVFRKGKTYNDIMPEETASKLRELHKKQFAGAMNPNFKPIEKETIIQAIQSGRNIRETANRIGMSYSGFYSKCKALFGKTPGEIKGDKYG